MDGTGHPRTDRKKRIADEKRLHRREDELLNRIANGEALQDICGAAGMPDHLTVLERVFDDFSFRKKYELGVGDSGRTAHGPDP